MPSIRFDTKRAGLDHDPTMLKSLPDQLAWVRERLAGAPFVDQCPSLR